MIGFGTTMAIFQAVTPAKASPTEVFLRLAISVVIVGVVWRQVFTRRRLNEIASWHPGQLAILGIVLAFIAWVLFQLMIEDVLPKGAIGAFVVVTLIALPAAFLRVLWEWFGHRNRAR